jgi:cystinosin
VASQAFNSALLGSPVIRDQYSARHHGHAPSVRWNDVFFAVHAFLISSLTLLQSLVYRVS